MGYTRRDFAPPQLEELRAAGRLLDSADAGDASAWGPGERRVVARSLIGYIGHLESGLAALERSGLSEAGALRPQLEAFLQSYLDTMGPQFADAHPPEAAG